MIRCAFRSIATFAAVASLIVTPCSAAEPTPTPWAGSSSSALKPIDQASLQALVTATAKELLVPGAVVLLRAPQGNFAVATGTTQLGTNNAPSTGTYFRIASNTKTMTAAIIMQLAQEGKLSLSDPISKYVSGVPGGDKITIAELLEMRSGLYNYTDAPEIVASLDHDPSRVWTPEELLAIAFRRPINAPPGTKFQYCNTNYALLGLVVEKVDGKPMRTAMQDRLFGPLGMKHTMLPVPASNTILKPFSHGYLYGSSSVALTGDPPYSPEEIAAARKGTLLPTDYTDVNHSFAAAAGGVISTADDLAIWIKALTTGRVLNAEYQRRWLDSLQLENPSNPAGAKYGYGISQLKWGAEPNSNFYLYHGGETPGYNSFIGYDPTNKITLVVWTNLTVSLDQVVTANTIMLKVLDHIYVVSPTPHDATPPPSPKAAPAANAKQRACFNARRAEQLFQHQ